MVQRSAQSVQIVFVIQRGELALKALLLAYSLRKHLGATARLVAACPDYADWGALEASVLTTLQKLKIELLHFTPEFAPDYPIGNKVSALGLLNDDQPAIFLDSDMLCLAPWTITEMLPIQASQQLSLAAKPADVLTWGSQQQWAQLQQGLGLPAVSQRVHCSVDGQLTQPYFNAGMLATYHPKQLTAHWLHYCKAIRNLENPPQPIYPWLDQIALAVCSITHVQQRYVLDEPWNFPAHLRALPRSGVKFCHYHRPGVVLREPALLALVREAAAKHRVIAQLLAEHHAWQPLLRAKYPQLRSKHLDKRDFIITGIPRSGTSLVSRLLDKQKNWLVVNEPQESIPALLARKDASGIGALHRDLREQILLGQPIENKVRSGAVISDTALGDTRELYHPDVSGRYFRLGSKNTLAYLASLDSLKKLNWPIVAMVRHPLDTLASWQRTFSHLQHADPQQLPVVNSSFYGWAGWQRDALDELAGQTDSVLRRVLLWRLLAQTLLAHSALHVWHYEQLVQQPQAHIQRLRRSLGDYGRAQPIESLSRRQRILSDNPHREYLGDLCAAEIRALGYLL